MPQFARAYPQATEFFPLKRKHDPDERFRNRFDQTYGLSRSKRLPAADPSST